MNLSRQNRIRWIGAAICLGAGMAALAVPVAQTIPFSNSFDYAAGTPVQALTNAGWDASDSSVQVQTNGVYADASAVVLPPNTALTNWVTGAMTNVWTDFYVQMEPRNDTNDADAVSNVVLKLYLDQTGYLKVYDRTSGWLTLSNTVRNSGMTLNAYTNGQWGRITLFQNYATHQCAVFLDGTLVREFLPFASNMNACTHFRLEDGASASSYFDNLSMTRVPPLDLADGAEIDAYGYLALTNYVGSGQDYTTIQSAINAALDRYVINVTNGVYTENVTVDRALGMITGGGFTINGTLAIASGLALTSAVGFTSGDLSVSNGSVLAVTGSLTASNVETGPGSALSVSGGMTNRDMTLGTNSTATIGQNLSASNLTLQAGARLIVGGTLFVTGTVDSAATATLVANGQVIGQSITINGGLVLGSGGGVTASNLMLGSSVTVAITNATVVVSNLSIGVGARLVVSNSTVTANGTTLSGSFTLDQNWGNQGASALLPYADNFEPYPVGTPMNALGYRGWGASDGSVAVEQGRYYSASNGVDIGFCQMLSNRVNAVAGQVWTDFRVIPTYDVNDETTAVRLTSAFMGFVTTNGYLSLYNRNKVAWEVCTNDIWGHSVSIRQAGQWSRLSVLCDYNKKTCAVFLDGVLLRQGFPFINTNLNSYSALSLVNTESNAACLDDVYVGTSCPATLTNDVNGNGIADAREIFFLGDIFQSGSAYKFR